MRFPTPYKRDRTFGMKKVKDTRYPRYNTGGGLPTIPISNTAIVIKTMLNGRPSKHMKVFLEDGTIRTRKV